MIHWKLRRAFGTNSDPFISDDVCGYLQPHFDEAAKLFHKLGKVVALITVHSWSLSMNVHDLVYWAWKQVVFLANIFYTGPEAASNSKPHHWWRDADGFQELCVTLNKLLVLKNIFFCNRMSQQQNLHSVFFFCEIFYYNFA